MCAEASQLFRGRNSEMLMARMMVHVCKLKVRVHMDFDISCIKGMPISSFRDVAGERREKGRNEMICCVLENGENKSRLSQNHVYLSIYPSRLASVSRSFR